MGYKKSEQSVAQIVTAATRVLARKGYARTSLMDIAKETGISKGAVHYHFPSKDQLIVKVLEHACDEVAERTRLAWSKGGSSVPELLDSAMRELWRVRAERSEAASVVVDLIAQSLHDETLRPKLAGYFQFAATQVQDHIENQLHSLGLTTKIPLPLLSRTLIGLMDGLVMQHYLEPEKMTEDDVLNTLGILASSLLELRPQDPHAS